MLCPSLPSVIARFHLRLPFTVRLPRETLEAGPSEARVGQYLVRLHPPYRSKLPWDLDTSQLDLSQTAQLLDRDETAAFDPASLLNGEPTIACDAIQVDLIAPTFDRSRGSDDPPFA